MIKCRRRQATDLQKLKEIVNGSFFVVCWWKRKRKRLKNNRFHIPGGSLYRREFSFCARWAEMSIFGKKLPENFNSFLFLFDEAEWIRSADITRPTKQFDWLSANQRLYAWRGNQRVETWCCRTN